MKMFRYKPGKSYEVSDLTSEGLPEEEAGKLVKYLNNSDVTVYEFVPVDEYMVNWVLKRDGLEVEGKFFRHRRTGFRRSRELVRDDRPSVYIIYYVREGFRQWHYYPED